MVSFKQFRVGFLLLGLLALPAVASAHVKWFSNFSFVDLPLTIGQVITPTVVILAVVSAVGMAIAVLLDGILGSQGWYQRLNQWFADREVHSLLIMRIGLGATLLMAWQADSLLVPRLPIDQAWLGWFQFALIFLLFFERTTPFAGWGAAFLYVIGMVEFGWFYMLDYLVFLGVAFYLIYRKHPNTTLSGLTIPALFFTTGFSLIWLGLEKLVYPQWGLYVLQQNPQLALGFPIDFFLVGAAFVELVLGYLLIIGLLERPLALVVTLVFFTTTTIFGKVEVIGHTIIHAALIVFLLEGVGNVYKPPVFFHERRPLRMAFASVNLILVLLILFVPYVWAAQRTHQHASAEVIELAQATTEREADTNLDFSVTYDDATDWLLTIDASEFDFVAVDVPEAAVPGDGFAHIYLDDQLVGLAFDELYQLGAVRTGTYEMRVSLHAPDGSQYVVDDEPIEQVKTITID